MFTKRFSKTVGRRLRVEGLEARTVPAAIAGTTASVMTTVDDGTKPADPVDAPGLNYRTTTGQRIG